MKFKHLKLGTIVSTENKFVIEQLKKSEDFKPYKEPKKKK